MKNLIYNWCHKFKTHKSWSPCIVSPKHKIGKFKYQSKYQREIHCHLGVSVACLKVHKLAAITQMQWFSNCSQWSVWIRIFWDLVKNANYVDACQAYKNKYLEGTIINQPAWSWCLWTTRDLWVLRRKCCFLSHCCHAFSAFQKTSGGEIEDLGWLGNLNRKRKRPHMGQGEKKTQQPWHGNDSAFPFIPSARASESQGAGSGKNLNILSQQSSLWKATGSQ